MSRAERVAGRRGVLRGMVAGAGMGLLAPLPSPHAAVAAERLPDVLLIGTSECAPPACVTGPALLLKLASLARSGFCFENFRADYPFRKPTWHELLAGCWNGSGAGREGGARRRTLPEIFAGHGYDTILADGPAEDVLGVADAVLRRVRAHGGRPFLAILVFDNAEDAIDAVAAAVQSTPPEMQPDNGLVVIHVPPFSWPRDWADTRPPLVVHAPDRVAGNARSGVAMNPLDVAPTVCGLAGIRSAESFQGTDYSGLAAARAGSRVPV